MTADEWQPLLHSLSRSILSDRGDAAILLLNPEVVFEDGEWEAWYFATWLPGAMRFRSFADLMRYEAQSAAERARG